MARVAVIGEPLRIYGYRLAGAVLRPAADRAEALAAWRALPDDIAVAVLTPSAARWLSGEIAGRPGVLPALLPAGLDEPAGQDEPGGLDEPGAAAGEVSA